MGLSLQNILFLLKTTHNELITKSISQIGFYKILYYV